MDISTVIGLILVIVAVFSAIFSGGDVFIFINLPSLIVVTVGVLGGTFIKWPIEKIKLLFAYVSKSLFFTPFEPRNIIEEIGVLAETARRDSIFALEKIHIEDPFLQKAATLAADNRPPEVIQSVMDLEKESLQDRHKIGQDILMGIGQDAPAFGMIGTLIGLVIMLQNLSDPSAIGPAMAIALLTTFYGVLIANGFALPMSNKLKFRSHQEQMKINMIVTGILGIVTGENPRFIKEKLNSFLGVNEREEEAIGEIDGKES